MATIRLRVFREWATRAGWGGIARPEPRRESAAEPDTEKLRDEVTTLRERLRTLEDRLEKRKTEGK